jgi:adenylate kinase
MILLMGVAGAGKSMQGRILADEYGYAWISTGEILRVLVTGKRRQEMLHGKLLSDIEIVELLDKVFELINTHEEFMLDGFPRTIPQADWLMRQIEKGRFELTAIVNLAATEEVVRDRLMKRGRIDDTEEAIARRFEEYEAVTKPIIDHFRSEGVQVHDIDASKPPQDVHDDIIKLLDNPKPLTTV